MSFLSPHRQPEPLLGLDLQADAARLVVLGRTRQGQQVLEHCACEPMGPGWLVEGRVDNFDAVTQAVSRLLRRTRVRAVNVAMALPEAAVITRRITLPRALAAEHLEARVRSEAERLIPFPLQEVYLDYGVLEPRVPAIAPNGPPHAPWPARQGEDADSMDLLLVAARRERVRDLQALAEAVGLKPVVVDVAAFAARRAVRHLMSRCAPERAGVTPDAIADEPARGAPVLALLDLRVDRVDWQLLRGDELVHEHQHARYFAADSGTLVEAGGGPSLARDLAPALSQALASKLGGRIDALWLTGEVGQCAGLAAALVDLLGCPCRVVNPFEGMVHRRAPPWRLARARREQAWLATPQEGAAAAYLQACGLALRRFQP
jgi:type IV pilus assembly protein PilM